MHGRLRGDPGRARRLTVEEEVAWLQVAVVTVKVWRKEGRLPAPIALAGGPVVRWQVSAVQHWLDEGCPRCGPGAGGRPAGPSKHETGTRDQGAVRPRASEERWDGSGMGSRGSGTSPPGPGTAREQPAP